MAGNLIGGRKAAATNKKLYGKSFYADIGAKGGKNGRTGGFYADREAARRAGALGGAISRRGDYHLSLEERNEIRADHGLPPIAA